MNILLHGLIGATAVGIVGPATYWAMEPFPFSDIKITATSARAEVSRAAVPMTVSMFVHKECPYLIERQVFDASGDTVALEQQTYTPTEKGSVDQGERLQAQAPATPGRGLLKARIGAMCNLAQRLYPRYSDWVEVRVNFSEPQR